MFDFLSVSEITGIIGLLGGAVAFLWNAHLKRLQEEYIRKEEKYKVLIESAIGFRNDIDLKEASKLRNIFLTELNKCWLYCPDKVIKAAYSFLASVDGETSANFSATQRDELLGELALSIRKDLLRRKTIRRTQLKAKDFKLRKANESTD